jgi:hypothetical protein
MLISQTVLFGEGTEIKQLKHSFASWCGLVFGNRLHMALCLYVVYGAYFPKPLMELLSVRLR